MLTIDGCFGEGGGQILRTSLSLSLVTGRAFRIVNIRAKRRKAGLLRQHLAAIRGAAALGGSKVTGAELGSTTLEFIPEAVTPGDYDFAVGSAGSVTLVLQTVLPPLILAAGRSTLRLEGGTHNPLAPPYEFLQYAFLPLLEKMGTHISTDLERPGFYPAGGGVLHVTIDPATNLRAFDLLSRGELVVHKARALISRLPRPIAERELNVLRKQMDWPAEDLEVMETESVGPGNALVALLRYENITEVVTGFGQKGIAAESVAGNVVREIETYLNSGAVVGQHLADQLMVPFALAGGGSFQTLNLSGHSETNLEVIRMFVPADSRVRPLNDQTCIVEFGRR